MALPKKSKCPTREVDVDGEKITVRGLTRSEQHSLAPLADAVTSEAPGALVALDAAVLAYGCSVTREEAAVWLQDGSAAAATALLDTIGELSGMGEGSKKD